MLAGGSPENLSVTPYAWATSLTASRIERFSSRCSVVSKVIICRTSSPDTSISGAPPSAKLVEIELMKPEISSV